MKNTFRVFIGGVFIIFLIRIVVHVYSIYIGETLNPSSKAYVDECIPAIVASWSKDELIKRASPELQAVTSNGQLDRLFAMDHKLGVFRRYNGAKGSVNINFSLKNGQVITASYVANVTFQNGKADIQIVLIRHNGLWQILGFHINSSAFLT